MKYITFISGTLCSGKSTVAKIIGQNSEKTTFIEVSDIVKDILQTTDRDKLVNNNHLDQEIVKEIIATIFHQEPSSHIEIENFIISGARQLSIIREIESYFSEKFEFQYIWVNAPKSTRFKNFQKRGDKKDGLDLSIETFDRYEKTDIDLGLLEVRNYFFNK